MGVLMSARYKNECNIEDGEPFHNSKLKRKVIVVKTEFPKSELPIFVRF